LREPLCTPPCPEFQGKAAILNCGRNTTTSEDNTVRQKPVWTSLTRHEIHAA
jgi:hypothetical protein